MEKVKAKYYAKFSQLKESLSNGSITPGEYERRMI